MKTSLIATFVALSLLALPAFAASISVSGGYQVNHTGGATQVATVNVATKLPASPLVLDVNLQDEVGIKRGGSAQEIEAGLTTTVIGPFWARAAVGYAAHDYQFRYTLVGNHPVLNPLANDFTYYNFTGGGSIPVAKKISLNGSVQYQNAFSTVNRFETWTTTAGTTYALNNNLGVRAFVSHQEGDRRSDLVGLGAALNF